MDLIKWGTNYLAEREFDEARLNIELLLSAALGVRRFDLYVKHDKPLTREELDKFKALLKRRLAHEPVQYIIGKTNFYSIDLKVDKRALIPRPETETLTESVIEYCRSYLSEKNNISILDIGTGSGCIAIALAKFVSNAQITAIDVDTNALDLAKENCQLNNVDGRIYFMEADLFKITGETFEHHFDIVVSNPPYVSKSKLASLPQDILKFEPVHALTDNGDGLTFYRALAEKKDLLVRPGGWIFVEVEFGKAGDVAAIFKKAGASEVYIRKDLSQVERVVSGRFGL
ncbi:MAG: peptide chain release factor N(5)-glutamine methyltransferase [Candidatus Kryptoniota bacterium]